MEIKHNEQTRRENRLMIATLFAFFISGSASTPLGSLIPFLRETYDLSYDFSGMLLSLQSTGNIIAILLAGVLPAYLGRRKTVLTTAIWMFLAYLVFTTGIGGAALLPAACLMTGVARGGNTNFSNTMMSTLPGKKSTVGYNLLHGAFAAGAFLAPLILILCTKHNPMGWRFVTGGIVVLCAAQLIVYAKMALPAETIEKGKGIQSIDRSFLKNSAFWLGAMILFFYVAAEYAIVGWLVTYFQDIGALSKDAAQMMNSLLWVVIFAGRMIGAVVVGKISRKTLLLIDGIGLFLFFTLVFFSRTQAPILFGIMGVGLFMATIYPSALALGTQKIKGNDLGVSIMILVGSSGGIVTPALVGFIAERAGIQAGMAVVLVTTILLLGTIVLSTVIKGSEEDT